MKVTRVFTGEDGLSRFEDLDIPLRDAGTIGRLSERFPAAGVIFRENDAGYDYDWHHAPRRQYIVLLDGEIEIETGDGDRRRFRGGDLLLVEDTADHGGRGHRTRSTDGKPRRSLFIPLD